MNDALRDLKTRIRQLGTMKFPEETGMRPYLEFAQALSRVHRLLRRADRTRAPTNELVESVGRAEALSPRVR